MVDEPTIIKYVALYLRKSRGEGEADLIKQKTILTDMCRQHNWTFVEYCEIESGDSLAMRPKMLQLLQDVENEMYDAVLVVDYDRLGRGDAGEQDRIKKAFIRSNTRVIDERSVYNLANDHDEFVIDIKGFLARQEYKTIVKRLVRGRKVGARLGRWCSGRPPFPYEYQRWRDKENRYGLVVNDEKLILYKEIKEKFLVQLETPNQIAADLNRRGILSMRGRNWRGCTIQRVLEDETHLGHIISNKISGDGHKKKKPDAKPQKAKPKTEWVRVENCHEAVKTPEEHEQILALSSRRKCGVVTRKASKPRVFSDLIRCGVCGCKMGFEYEKPKHGTDERIRRCWNTTPTGEKCSNWGGPTRNIVVEFNKQLDEFEINLTEKIKNYRSNVNVNLKRDIDGILKEIAQQEKQVEFIYEQYEKGIYSEAMFKERRAKAETKLKQFNETLEDWQIQLKVAEAPSDQDRLVRLGRFRQELASAEADPIGLNALYKNVLESIVWRRERGGEIMLEFNFW